MRTCPLAATCPRPRSGLPEDFLSRREWVKRVVIGSAVSLAGGSFKSTLLADIAPGANPANILKFNLASYPTLQSDYGSMRFNLFGATVPNGIITVTRAPGNVFYAVSAYCTHAGSIVEPYDNSPGTQAMICYSHNSVYDIQGRVISGAELLQNNLPAYNTSLSGNTLSVEIPNLNLKVENIRTANPVDGISRLQISFRARSGARYRVLHLPNLTETPVVVPVATSATGSATATPITQLSNALRSVWVPSSATSGFYMVEMMVAEYAP